MLRSNILRLRQIPTQRMFGTSSSKGNGKVFDEPPNYGGMIYQMTPENLKSPYFLEYVNLALDNYNKETNSNLELVDVVSGRVTHACGKIYWFTSLFKDQAGNHKLFNGGIQKRPRNKLDYLGFDPAPNHQQAALESQED